MKPRLLPLPPGYELDDIALWHVHQDRIAEAVAATAEAIDLGPNLRFQIGLVLIMEDIHYHRRLRKGYAP